MNPFRPPWPIPDDDVRAALERAWADGTWGQYQGPHAEALAAALRSSLGVPHITLCSSGTIATELALRGARVGPGDEVLLAAYDFPGNFRAIEAVGAQPVLVDLALDRWTLDAANITAAVSPSTRAVIVSHLHGDLAEMAAIRAVAKERQLFLIEDACQTPGATVQGRPAGTWGDCGLFSFGGSKLLTAGRGGAVVTPHADVAQRIKVYADRGNDAFPLSELQAAVLLPQWQKLDVRNQQRQRQAGRLRGALGASGLFGFPPRPREVDLPAYYKLGLWLSAPPSTSLESIGEQRDRFLFRAHAAGLPIDAGFRGFALRSGRRCRSVGDLPHARLAAARTLLIHHPVLLADDDVVDRLADELIAAAE